MNLIKPEIDNMSDGKRQIVIEVLNKLCDDGFCQDSVEPRPCKTCPLVRESIRRFGVDVVCL